MREPWTWTVEIIFTEDDDKTRADAVMSSSPEDLRGWGRSRRNPLDPDLPAELLPGGWPRADARELFIGCYDLLGPLAALRVRQIITRYSPELADRAAYHSSELKLSAAPDPLAADG